LEAAECKIQNNSSAVIDTVETSIDDTEKEAYFDKLEDDINSLLLKIFSYFPIIELMKFKRVCTK
jgi:hypothetical protein